MVRAKSSGKARVPTRQLRWLLFTYQSIENRAFHPIQLSGNVLPARGNYISPAAPPSLRFQTKHSRLAKRRFPNFMPASPPVAASYRIGNLGSVAQWWSKRLIIARLQVRILSEPVFFAPTCLAVRFNVAIDLLLVRSAVSQVNCHRQLHVFMPCTITDE